MNSNILICAPLVIGLAIIIACGIYHLFGAQMPKYKLMSLMMLGFLILSFSAFAPALDRFSEGKQTIQIIGHIEQNELTSEQVAQLASYSSKIAIPKYFYSGMLDHRFFSSLEKAIPELSRFNNDKYALIWACNAVISDVSSQNKSLKIIAKKQMRGFDFIIISLESEPEAMLTWVSNESDFFHEK